MKFSFLKMGNTLQTWADGKERTESTDVTGR